MKIVLFSIITLLLFNTKALDCDCAYLGNFLEVAPKTDLVALVKVRKQIDETRMEVQIIEVIKGVEKRKNIIFWGDNGNQCLVYCSEFKINQEYLIAFYNHKKKKSTEKQEFEISSCGEYWLNIEKQKLKRVTISSNDEVIKKIPYKEIRKKLIAE